MPVGNVSLKDVAIVTINIVGGMTIGSLKTFEYATILGIPVPQPPPLNQRILYPAPQWIWEMKRRVSASNVLTELPAAGFVLAHVNAENHARRVSNFAVRLEFARPEMKGQDGEPWISLSVPQHDELVRFLSPLVFTHSFCKRHTAEVSSVQVDLHHADGCEAMRRISVKGGCLMIEDLVAEEGHTDLDPMDATYRL